jgi:hypothetical protein
MDSEELVAQVERLMATHICGDAVAVLRRARQVREDEIRAGKKVAKLDLDPRIRSAVEAEDEFRQLLEDMANKKHWKVHGTKRGCQICVDSRPDMRIRFRCETVMDLDMVSCLAVSNEVDDYKSWMPGIDTSGVVKFDGNCKRTGRVSGWKPWPLGREEMVTAALAALVDGADLIGPDKGYGTGFLISVKPDNDYPRTPGVRAVDLTGGYWFEPVTKSKTRVIFLASVDPHIYLPDFLLNWILANVAYLMLPMHFKQAKLYAPGGKLHHIVTNVDNEMYAKSHLDVDLLLKATFGDQKNQTSGKGKQVFSDPSNTMGDNTDKTSSSSSWSLWTLFILFLITSLIAYGWKKGHIELKHLSVLNFSLLSQFFI